MLAIRLQRKGRSGHAQFRVIVQDSRFSPKSGKIVDYIGSYDPHSKTANVDKEKADKFLKSGARPSNRVAKILKAEKIELPAWVEIDTSMKGKLKNPDKLRKNRPDEPEETQTAPAADSGEGEGESPEAEEDAKTDEKAEPAEEKPEEGSKDDKSEDEPKAEEDDTEKSNGESNKEGDSKDEAEKDEKKS